MSTSHLDPVPNKYRSTLHELPGQHDWTSNQARGLVEAILRGTGITDISAALPRVNITVEIASIPLGTTAGNAITAAMAGIDRALVEIDALRREITSSAGQNIIPHSDPVIAPPRNDGDTREIYMLRWIRHVEAQGLIITRAGDSAVMRDASGAYRVPAMAEA